MPINKSYTNNNMQIEGIWNTFAEAPENKFEQHKSIEKMKFMKQTEEGSMKKKYKKLEQFQSEGKNLKYIVLMLEIFFKMMRSTVLRTNQKLIIKYQKKKVLNLQNAKSKRTNKLACIF
jgi:hypothetical protein